MKTYNQEHATCHDTEAQSHIHGETAVILETAVVAHINGDVYLPYVEQNEGGHASLETHAAASDSGQCANEITSETDAHDQSALVDTIGPAEHLPSTMAMAVASTEYTDTISGCASLPQTVSYCDSAAPEEESPAVPHSGVEEMPEMMQGDDGNAALANKVATTELRIDAELQALIEPLTSEELAGLEASLLQDGCRDPLVVWEGLLLDGHNRYALCCKHGIAFQTVEKAGLVTKADAKIWMIENQLGKRNTSHFDRAALALRLKPLIEQRAQERMLAGKAQPEPVVNASANPVQNSAQGTGKSRDTLAKVAGVSHDTMRKVEQIITKATPEVMAKVRSGELSINAAAKTVTPPKPAKAVALAPSNNCSMPEMAAAQVGKPGCTDALTPAEVKQDFTKLSDNEVPRDLVPASQAQTELPTDATSTFDAGEESPPLIAPVQEPSLQAELDQVRAQVVELQARLGEVEAENKMMADIFAADNKVLASMLKAAEQKKLRDADNCELYLVKIKFNKLNEAFQLWNGLIKKALAAQLEPASVELAALCKELDELKTKYSDITPT